MMWTVLQEEETSLKSSFSDEAMKFILNFSMMGAAAHDVPATYTFMSNQADQSWGGSLVKKAGFNPP
jgi:hypothetical protein